jgi:hypothetical protein
MSACLGRRCRGGQWSTQQENAPDRLALADSYGSPRAAGDFSVVRTRAGVVGQFCSSKIGVTRYAEVLLDVPTQIKHSGWSCAAIGR